MAGGMGVAKNKFIEDWAAHRENLEQHFRFSRRNLALIFTFGILAPIAIYKASVAEAHTHDKDYGSTPSKFL